MKTIKLGEYNLLTVTKLVDFGLYLDGGDAEEILLPARYVPEGTKVGDEHQCFYLSRPRRTPCCHHREALCEGRRIRFT